MNVMNNLYVILVLRVLHIGGGIRVHRRRGGGTQLVRDGHGILRQELGRIEKLRAELESSQGAPNPAKVQEMNRLQSPFMKLYQFDFVLLTVSMLAMAIARYL